MTVTFTALYELTAANQLSSGQVTLTSADAGIIDGGFIDFSGNLIFVGYGGQSVTMFEPSAVSLQAGDLVEFTKTATGYSTTPTVLTQFSGTNGVWPQGPLISDSAGNLYGVTRAGGSLYQATGNSTNNGYGEIYEIAKTASGYAGAPTVLASFTYQGGASGYATGYFPSGLVMDSNGNLFGATNGGGPAGIQLSGGGTVFELAKTANGYSSTPTILAAFPDIASNLPTQPQALTIDKDGNLFGILAGTPAVFEIAKTANGYAGTPTILANLPAAGFQSANYSYVGTTLLLDANGDIFGADNGPRTVFEIAKTATGYAGSPVNLGTLSGSISSLILDSNGDLFGTTKSGGANGLGIVFEITRTAGVYAAASTTLYTFGGTDGSAPYTLMADASGNLIGATYGGGTNSNGVLFELSGTGYTVSAATALKGPLTSAAPIGDTAASIEANLDALQTLAAAGKIASITLTDSSALSVTAAQLTSDAAALKAISGSITLSVAAPATNTSVTGLVGEANTVTFSGTGSQYTITPTGNGTSFTISGNGVTDQVSGVQALQFSDHTDIVAAQPGTSTVTSGNITELYSAVFGRTPDLGGLSFYQNFLAKNPATPLQQFAQWFLASSEYQNNPAHAYAQTVAGDQQFVSDSYQNLLHRMASASEVSFYENNVIAPALANLTPGTAAYAAADAQAHALTLVYFSQSAEFLGDVQVTAQNPTSAQHWLVLI